MRFPVGEGETVTSPFTGRELRKLQTKFRVAPHTAELVRAFLATGSAADTEGSFWSGNLDMESYSDAGPHTLTITWSESERLHADTVEFEGLTLVPTDTKYEERVNEDGSIFVTFQANLTPDETDRLRTLIAAKHSDSRYWSVIRRGVSDEPRNMRLGRVLWQQLADGRIGHDITLVDEAFDPSDAHDAFRGLAGEPQIGNLIEQVSVLLARFETLLTELEASGTVAPEAIGRVRTAADTLAAARSHIFFEVADLSRW